MSLDGGYDMILLSPPGDNDNGGRQPARRRRNRRRLPRVVEEQPSSSPRPLPRRRRRGRGNQGQAGGSASSAVERVDSASTSTGGALGIDLALETKTSAVSPRHANPEQTDDASTLAEGLLGVTLVPETTMQSVPDVTSSPPVDQEVPTDSHPMPFGFSLDPPSGFALADALVEASPNPLGFRMRVPWDRLTDVSTYGPSGSEEDDEPSFCWDFSGLGNPSAMRDFMTACDYCLSDCSDGSRSLGDEDCGPSRECFHVDLGGPSEGNHLGMPEDGDLPRPVPRVDIPRELAVVPVQAGAMTHSSSKSAGCRPGSTREQERLSRSAGTSDRHGRANLRPEKYVIYPRASSTASPTTSGSGRHPHLVGSARTWLQQQCSSVRCWSHQPPRGGESRESSRISWKAPRSGGPRAPPPEGRGTPRSIMP
jgi:hypothetical protein